MALFTSEFDAIALLEHRLALITSNCAPPQIFVDNWRARKSSKAAAAKPPPPPTSESARKAAAPLSFAERAVDEFSLVIEDVTVGIKVKGPGIPHSSV